jgi:hypothetical protein
MKVAYIAGPYRARNGRSVAQNIKAAEEVAIKYWKAGFSVICPHMNTALLERTVSEDFILEADLEIVRRIDTMVMMANWTESLGAIQEHSLAKDLRKEIIYDEG